MHKTTIPLLEGRLIGWLIRNKLAPKWRVYSSTSIGNNIGFTHHSVKRGYRWWRILGHVLAGRVCFQNSFEGISSVFCVKIGPGFGYVSGLTFYCAFFAHDVRPGMWHFRRIFQIGFGQSPCP